MKMKPFVKWVGGKRQLLDIIDVIRPFEYNRYIEPFVGGGAVFFNMEAEKVLINDLNKELITTYKIINSNKNDLIKSLNKHAKNHSEDYYLEIRGLNPEELTDVEVAGRFIYLNKTGFNGLYRVNSSGKFNVPCGKKDPIKQSGLYSKTNIDRISKYMKENDVQIKNTSFEHISVNEGDFLFVDPPYDSDDDKSFDSYTTDSFGKQGQKNLAKYLKLVDKKGAKFILTNHNTRLIRELYREYEIIEVPVNRFVNSNAKERVNSATEVLIFNYKLKPKQKKLLEQAMFFRELKSTSHEINNYISWDKIKSNMSGIELKLNDLNYLMSRTTDEFDSKFNELFEIGRIDSFSILPLLIAKRIKKGEKFSYILLDDSIEEFDYKDKTIVEHFINESGLKTNLFVSANQTSVREYMLGMEVGLSSNDKKNKVGLWMAQKIELILKENNIVFEKEVSYNKLLNMNLTKDKYFDFVFDVEGVKYCLECNFFNSSGSKINSETERFIALDQTFKSTQDMEFVWVTDGYGLKKNKQQLINALEQINHMYNLTRFEKFIELIK